MKSIFKNDPRTKMFRVRFLYHGDPMPVVAEMEAKNGDDAEALLRRIEPTAQVVSVEFLQHLQQ